MKSDARIEPPRFPRPPTTTTTNARTVKSNPIVWVTPANGPKSPPAAPPHPGADREHRGVDQRDRDSHRLRHHPVLSRRADPDAVLAVLQEEPQPGEDQTGHHRRHDAVPGILQVEQIEIAADRVRGISTRRVPPPEPLP